MQRNPIHERSLFSTLYWQNLTLRIVYRPVSHKGGASDLLLRPSLAFLSVVQTSFTLRFCARQTTLCAGASAAI